MSEEPKQDGYIEITFVTGEIKRYEFADIHAHSGEQNKNGLVIWLEKGRLFYPWVQIMEVRIRYNSDAYVEWTKEHRQRRRRIGLGLDTASKERKPEIPSGGLPSRTVTGRTPSEPPAPYTLFPPRDWING